MVGFGRPLSVLADYGHFWPAIIDIPDWAIQKRFLFQFLDAVYQLMCQFPEAFEFSERLLIFIAEHLFSARFGNFLFNNVKDRLAHNLHTKTRSIWSFILHQDNRRQFLHPIYDKNSHLFTLVPNTSVIRMTFWIRLYNKANPRYSKRLFEII